MFRGDWERLEDVARDFELKADELARLQAARVVLAVYERYAYEGYAYVLFEHEGELYDVHATHCSCYGLEQQWEPDVTSVAFLLQVLESPWCNEFREHLRAALNELQGGR